VAFFLSTIQKVKLNRRFIHMPDRREILKRFGIGLAENKTSSKEKSSSEEISPEIHFLNRTTYGPTLPEIDQIKKGGIESFLEEQLHPDENKDVLVQEKLNTIKLLIKYKEKLGKHPARDEELPLTYLNSPLDKLWELTDNKMTTAKKERTRPAEEVRAASWIRAVYSKYQLKEIMVEFWHNHFNVNPFGDDKIAATFPVYDREVIRKNCFGNFRVFLEDVAKSTAMQYSLDNYSSKASPANENYARELFELHTLGSDNYLNTLYNRWKEVPGALNGKPIGYIDEDVYEAARAFTGWTIANGAKLGKKDVLPDNGGFYYVDGWHDNYQKRVLGVEFEPNQPHLADGRKVLDLVAFHPSTAKHLAKKLCVRFVSDDPSDALISRTATTWIKYKDSPDQIAQTLTFILNSSEFKSSAGRKVKRPFEYLASIFRVTGTDFTPVNKLSDMLNPMGYFHFQWPTPTGHPDISTYWLYSNAMLARWNSADQLISSSSKFSFPDFKSITPMGLTTPEQVAEFWTERILHKKMPSEFIGTVAGMLSSNKGVQKVFDPNDLKGNLNTMIALILMSPDFQLK
jgi:uncharacterized protein (DUF1800 family)